MHIYQISGRNLEVTQALHNYVEQKLSKLERFNGQITNVRVVLTVRDVKDSNRRNTVEVQLNVPNGIIRSEEHNADMYAAIDKASDVLERQLRKYKTRLMRHRHEDLKESISAAQAEIYTESSEVRPEIVRQKQFDMRPMSPEDAALQMEALGHDFYVFQQLHGKVGVVYRRKDGHYGLIEPVQGTPDYPLASSRPTEWQGAENKN